MAAAALDSEACGRVTVLRAESDGVPVSRVPALASLRARLA